MFSEKKPKDLLPKGKKIEQQIKKEKIDPQITIEYKYCASCGEIVPWVKANGNCSTC